MRGTIRKRHIVAHPAVTIRCFGWKVFLRALFAGSRRSFVSLLTDSGIAPPDDRSLYHLLGRSVNLELRAMRIYESLARRFTGPASAREFFETIARHEAEHAELLDLCRIVSRPSSQIPYGLQRWRDTLPVIGARLREVEAAVSDVADLSDALQLVMDVESSGLNEVFSEVLLAVDSAFIVELEVIRTAMRRHVDYVCEKMPELDPARPDLDDDLAAEVS